MPHAGYCGRCQIRLHFSWSLCNQKNKCTISGTLQGVELLSCCAIQTNNMFLSGQERYTQGKLEDFMFWLCNQVENFVFLYCKQTSLVTLQG